MSEIARLADEYEKATRYFESLAEKIAEKEIGRAHV